MNTETFLELCLILAVMLIPAAFWTGIQIGQLRATEDSTPESIREN